jgi:hypothetical protein
MTIGVVTKRDFYTLIHKKLQEYSNLFGRNIHVIIYLSTIYKGAFKLRQPFPLAHLQGIQPLRAAQEAR